jgi:thiosulfate/3-mercaptopyruvate sulfurtransferase
VWWTFKVFGHKSVSVLDGGFPAWQRAGGELDTSPPKEYPSVAYPVPQLDRSLVRTFEEITDLAKKNDKSVQILDARSTGRYITIHSLLTLDFMVTNPSHAKVSLLKIEILV